MAWLAANGTETKAGRAGDPPAPYAVRCRCGEVAKGYRVPLVQRVRCQKCEFEHFILPVSVYPLPNHAKSGRSGKKKQGKGKSRRNRAEVSSVVTSVTGNVLGLVLFPFVRLGTWIATQFQNAFLWLIRPLRLVAICLLVILVGTGYWTSTRWKRDAATRLLLSAPQRGEELLKQHQVLEAAAEFQAVEQAVDLLQRKDPNARRWKQWSRELRAVVQLSPATILELVQDAEEHRSQPPLHWERDFQQKYKDRWLMLDTTSLIRGERGPQRVECPVRIGGKLTFVQVRFGSLPLEGLQRLILVGQLEKCVADPQEGWRIELTPNSVVLLTNPEVYAFATLSAHDPEADPETQQQLKLQAERLEVSDP